MVRASAFATGTVVSVVVLSLAKLSPNMWFAPDPNSSGSQDTVQSPLAEQRLKEDQLSAYGQLKRPATPPESSPRHETEIAHLKRET
jgi:hypothetical protein